MSSVAAIVLAAGQSRRMGTQKLLLPFGKTTAIARIVDEVLQSDVTDTCLVVGGHERAIRAALVERTVQWVRNPDARGDMLSSIRCGLNVLSPACTGVMVVLGDQPGVHAAMINALIHAFDSGNRSIVVPTCQGRRGHPLIFARQYATEILEQHDRVGLRGLLQVHAAEVMAMPWDDNSPLEDMDTPEDYRRLQAALKPRTAEPLE